MNLKELIDELNKKYGDKFLGSTGNDKELIFYFNVNNSKKTIIASTSDSNEVILEKIESILGGE